MKKFVLLIISFIVITGLISCNVSSDYVTEKSVEPINDYSFCNYDLGLGVDEEIVINIPVFFEVGANDLSEYRDLQLDFVSFNGQGVDYIDVELINTGSGVYFDEDKANLNSTYSLIEYTVKLSLNNNINEEIVALDSMRISIDEVEYDIPVTITISNIETSSFVLPYINYSDEPETNIQSLFLQLFSTDDYDTFLDIELLKSESFDIGLIEYANVDSSNDTLILNPPFSNWYNQPLDLDPTNTVVTLLKVHLETIDEKAFNPYSSGIFELTFSLDDEELTIIRNVFIGSNVIEALIEYEESN